MHRDSLPQLRRQLFDWLQIRLASGRLPFRRVEEAPSVLTGTALATPDLVLWINRDSLLAGAMIFILADGETSAPKEASMVAASLGLRQFVTWGTDAVKLWDTATSASLPRKSWHLPVSGASSSNFAAVFEQLLAELKSMAVSAILPAEQLPAGYFANLCRQVLRDSEPSLQETARLTMTSGQPDSTTLQHARDKGWLTLWRLLALLQHDRMPPAVRPERLDRALVYALAELDAERFRQLAPAAGEAPLAEATAVRFHHLGGRLTQLGWQRDRERALVSLTLLCAAAARDCGVETAPLDPAPDGQTLLINHLPPQVLDGATVVAPWPCLAGLTLLGTDPSAPLHRGVTSLPAAFKPRRIVATFRETQPLPAKERRPRLAALRQPWPYRRFRLASTAPGWLWDAMHLGGLVDPDGVLQLTLPVNWALAVDAELLWRTLADRLVLKKLLLQADGRQTLFMSGKAHGADLLELHHPDGTVCQLPTLPEDAPVSALAALTLGGGVALPSPPLLRKPRSRPVLAETIAAKVFRDGLPNFPEHYLRRFDLPPLRTYQLPGPLHADTHFFDRVRLKGADGTWVDADNPVDAEALLLASCAGRRQVDLPTDTALTARLIAAYRDDLQRLWQELLAECRRQHTGQRSALTLARRLWRERALPVPEATE
jgi:hypothetical protein